MLTMGWEVCYEIPVYKSKLSQIKTSTFLKKDVYVNKGTLQIFIFFY